MRFDYQRALRRGGSTPIHSLDAETAEGRYRLEPSHEITPEAVYERRWALMVLKHTLDRLKNQSPRYEALAPFLTGAAPVGGYEKVAPELGMSEGALKVAVHRLRRQYREALRAEIAQTVSDQSEVAGEIRYLMEILSRSQKEP